MRGTEVTFERCAKALGAIGIEERAGLDGVPVSTGGGGGDGEDVDTDGSAAGSDECDGDGGGMREIDDAVLDEGAAIDDADIDGFVVVEIDDPHPRSERQCAMRGGEAFHIV